MQLDTIKHMYDNTIREFFIAKKDSLNFYLEAALT
jgi:hypothetical protein